MAEGFTQNVTCRYYLNGVCREGSSCHFSHDRQNTRPSSACRFYLRGACTYGENCRYDHIRQERLDASRSKIKKQDTPLPVVKPVQIPRESTSQNSKLEKSKLISISPPKFKSAVPLNSSLCVDAPEFIPRFTKEPLINGQVSSEVSFAQVVGDECASLTVQNSSNKTIRDSYNELCPFYVYNGVCKLNPCTYVHGLMCEMCQLPVLHPDDEKQRNSHVEECTRELEADMENAFAYARSQEKVCGICMDTVMEKSMCSQRRFGILPNCSHCFCLDCLRKWRQSKQFENKIVRACPECRVQSDYVVPSRFWVDDKEKEEKKKLMDSYRDALSAKPCKYFKQGDGQCPFGNKCFYLHALPDGTRKDVGPPKRKSRFNAEGELQLYLDNMLLWDFIEEREGGSMDIYRPIRTFLLQMHLEDDLAEDLLFPDDSGSDSSDFR